MDWENERYVRVYVSDTADWSCLSWQARCLWLLILRKLDRSGVLSTSKGPKGVAALVAAPLDMVSPALAELLEDGCLVATASGYCAPNFLDAQEAKQSDKLRQQESRARRREEELRESGQCQAPSRPVTPSHTPSHPVTASHGQSHAVTNRDQGSQNVTDGHAPSRAVTSGHAPSHDVTLAEPSFSELSQSNPSQPSERVSDSDARANPSGTGVPGNSTDPARLLATRAWDYGRVSHTALKASGVDPNARACWDGLPSGTGAKEFYARARELLVVFAGDTEKAYGEFCHVVDVVAARAQRTGQLTYHTPSRISDPKSFALSRESTPEQESTGPAKAAPVRDIRVGRVEPRPAHEYPEAGTVEIL